MEDDTNVDEILAIEANAPLPSDASKLTEMDNRVDAYELLWAGQLSVALGEAPQPRANVYTGGSDRTAFRNKRKDREHEERFASHPKIFQFFPRTAPTQTAPSPAPSPAAPASTTPTDVEEAVPTAAAVADSSSPPPLTGNDATSDDDDLKGEVREEKMARPSTTQAYANRLLQRDSCGPSQHLETHLGEISPQ